MTQTKSIQFGSYEKRNKVLRIDCTIEERERWKLKYGRNLANALRTLLNKQIEKGGIKTLPARPPFKKLVYISIRCTESELFFWRMISARAGKCGGGSALKAIACYLLNQGR